MHGWAMGASTLVSSTPARRQTIRRLTRRPTVAYDVRMGERDQTRRGLFVVLEGGEGSGKSRLQAALVECLAADGVRVVATREPGGTVLGERIRDLILADRSVDDPLAELLLFEAARAHLVSEVIRPNLEAGRLVLCDRFVASSIAYQGAGRGIGREVVERANEIATGRIAPDLTLLLDLPVEAGLARRSSDGAGERLERGAGAV